MLENPGAFPSRRIRADSPGARLLADTKQGPQALFPGEGHRERLFLSVKLLTLFVGQPWPVMPCRLSCRQLASQTQAR